MKILFEWELDPEREEYSVTASCDTRRTLMVFPARCNDPMNLATMALAEARGVFSDVHWTHLEWRPKA